MLSRETKRRLATLAVFAAPMGAVKLAAVLLGGGPAGGEAAVAEAEAPAVAPVPIVSTPPNAAQVAAADHIAWLKKQSLGATPFFYHPPDQPEPQTPDAVETPPEVAPIVDSPRIELVLQMIMSTPEGNVALINGKARRAGDALDAEGRWVLTAIDSVNRSVTVTDGKSGEALLFSLK